MLQEDGHNDFAVDQRRTGKIARIFRNIVHHDGLPAAGRGAAESGVEGMRALGVKLPTKGPTSRTPSSAGSTR